MATIYQLSVTSEDRKACADMTRNLVQIYLHKKFIQANIKRISEEWKSIARRIKAGEKMIEEMLEDKNVKTTNPQHYKDMSDLYYLLVTLSSFYERFFTSAFSPQETARWNKVQAIFSDVHEILCL
jgi:hypothetical protein